MQVDHVIHLNGYKVQGEDTLERFNFEVTDEDSVTKDMEDENENN